MASHVKVRFIDESGLVNKGNGFILRDCPSWEKIYQNTPYGTINIHGKKVPFEQSIPLSSMNNSGLACSLSVLPM